jgi:uncharacterized RDD family membrane protein YckC
VTCRYCETVNSEGWTRCQKCDAPLSAPVARARPSRRRSAAAAAAQQEVPDRPPQPAPADAEPGLPAQGSPRPAYQPSLFGGKDASKVVSIRPGTDVRTRAVRGLGHRSAVAGAPRYEQQRLSLAETRAAPRQPAQEGVVFCNAPVAKVARRVLAFAIDFSLVAAASGLVALGTIYGSGVPLAGKQAAVFCGAGLLLVWALYQLLWCAANLDSAGMNWMRLRVLDFNGCRPKPRQRFIRLGVTCLGTLAAGLGLAWALVDEENLTWQDHVSESFPTPY